jgi:undecaprenyl-diphosphatase
MSLWLAALLGLVQGITEFLPISSTAHLRIAPALLGEPDPGAAFTAVIQLGTLVAVMVYYRRRLWAMTRGILWERGGPNARLALQVIVGTIPIGIAGVLLKHHVEGSLRSLYVIAGALVVVAGLMVLAERVAKAARTIDQVTFVDAIVVGCAQACALVPGTSRSGATITAALLVGLSRPAAAELSFLLSIPALGAAGVFELGPALSAFRGGSALPLAVATGVAALAGYAAIAWLLRYLRTHSFAGFALYRVVLGGALLALVATGVLSP